MPARRRHAAAPVATHLLPGALPTMPMWTMVTVERLAERTEAAWTPSGRKTARHVKA